MKIIQLTAENVKKLKVVDITPTDGLVQVTGRNGSGKSSVLDSIWWALGGKEGIQSVPIRKGAERGRIRLDLGSMIVERTFTPSGTSVIALNPAGAQPGTPDKKLPRWSSPQELLDALLGDLSFDPLAFTRMSSKAQFDELRRIAKLSIDIEALDAANAADFKSRTEVNREARSKRAQAEAIVIPADTPAALVDETALLDKLQAAGEHNALIEQRKARRDQAIRDVADKRAEARRLDEAAIAIKNAAAKHVKELQDRIALVQREAELNATAKEEQAIDVMREAGEIQKRLDSAEPLPEPLVTADLRAELEAAKKSNTLVRRRSDRDAFAADAVALEGHSKTLTEQMAAREKQKVDAIAATEMPVAGLGFGDGVVTYNGLPFDQASGAEQLRVSVSIAMAANPKLRVIRIKDGGLLDEDGIRMIAEMARDKDYQVWLERVDTSGKIGVVMEDGEIVSTEGAAA